MVDYGKSGRPKGGNKEPRNKTVNEHPKGKLGRGTDKAELLERMKKAAAEAKAAQD